MACSEAERIARRRQAKEGANGLCVQVRTRPIRFSLNATCYSRRGHPSLSRPYPKYQDTSRISSTPTIFSILNSYLILLLYPTRGVTGSLLELGLWKTFESIFTTRTAVILH